MAQDRDSRVVAGLFPDMRSARDAVTELKAAGFTNKEIGLAMTNPTEAAMQTETVTDTRAAEEAATGAVGGGVLGGLTGLLVAAGVVAIPGLGALLAGGVLASALGITGASVVAGTGLGAATGGLVGGLIGLDIPESDARHFEAGIRSGRVLVLVHARERIEEAQVILQRHHGETDVGTKPSSPEDSGAILI
jgi:hypothetical protein